MCLENGLAGGLSAVANSVLIHNTLVRERPDTVVLLETWSTRETMDEHGKVNATRTPIGRELLTEPPNVERYES